VSAFQNQLCWCIEDTQARHPSTWLYEGTLNKNNNGLRLVMTFSYSIYSPQFKLSTKELLEISEEINREFAPEFSSKKPEPASQHKLSSKELFEISEEIRLEFAPKASNNTQELVLLPVDPDHLYAYWNLGDDIFNTTQKNDFGNQLTLRIYPEPNKNTNTLKTKSWFDVAIDSAQAQQKVILPARTHETTYSASIGKRFPDNNLIPFASSNITYVPPGKVVPNQVKESQIVFKPLPQPITASRKIAIYTNNSASGQGNN
jgi:hypothetical protein